MKYSLGQAELQTLEFASEQRRVIRHGLVQAGGILRIAAGDGVEQKRGIADGFGEGADLVERRGESDEPETRDAAVGRLEAHAAAERGRLADRAAGIRAERGEGLIRRDDRRGAAARAARDAGRVPRVMRVADTRSFPSNNPWRIHPVRSAERNGAGGAQFADDRGVVIGSVAAQDFRAAGAGFAV